MARGMVFGGRDQADMVGSDDEIEDGQPVALFGFKKQLDQAIAVSGKFQQKPPLMAPVGQMPEEAWNEMPVGACHWR